jgi:hypothetical protein
MLARNVRRYPRRTVTVSFGPNAPPVPCVIWDISQSGARLSIARPTADLPHRFTLNLQKQGSVKRDCEIVWFNAKYIGVKFNGLVS